MGLQFMETHNTQHSETASARGAFAEGSFSSGACMQASESSGVDLFLYEPWSRLLIYS